MRSSRLEYVQHRGQSSEYKVYNSSGILIRPPVATLFCADHGRSPMLRELAGFEATAHFRLFFMFRLTGKFEFQTRVPQLILEGLQSKLWGEIFHFNPLSSWGPGAGGL